MKLFNKLALLSLGLILFGCEHKKIAPEINVELYGKWSNDNNCNLILSHQDNIKNSIKISQFTDGKGTILNNQNLTFRKDGVYTLFQTTNAITNFKIVYVEGTMTIDKYCTTPLHKIDN